MSSLFKILSDVKRKLVEPKIYALTLMSGGSSYLGLVAAYSLEEALGKARRLAVKDHPNLFTEKSMLSLGMHTCESIDSLLGDVMDMKLEKQEVGDDKNKLMARIIETKDATLLAENRSKFSEPEVAFLEEKIKTK